uniref:Uncharacterized protein n=1 Tax=Oryza brachyantha TaxID=4533 RepID=J3L1Y6_ORYBR
MPEVRRPEAHWLDRLLELRSRFHDPAKRHSSDNDLFNNADEDDDVYRLDGDEYHHHDGCGVNYEDDDEHVDGRWDRESFSKLLARAPLGEARLFAQLAFLCNMAYVIPEIKRQKKRVLARTGWEGSDSLASWQANLLFEPTVFEGAALFRLDPDGRADRPARHVVESALRAFLNSPHPLETLSDLSAYGSEGAILRDHESSNYFRALNALTRVPRRRKQPEIVWQLPGVERLQQYWWPGIAGTVFPAPPVTVRNKELITEA